MNHSQLGRIFAARPPHGAQGRDGQQRDPFRAGSRVSRPPLDSSTGADLGPVAFRLELDKWLSYDNSALTASLETYRAKMTKAKETEIREAAEEAREQRPYWLLQDAPKSASLSEGRR